ncbi:MAG: cation:dicarboxylase symporter family transporter [Planctomycetes bacterium]|nr:cation:dicarboxylase symporter family transporter [Planctomycetota bacterium]
MSRYYEATRELAARLAFGLGLALGVLLGVFIGEPAGALSIGGDIYIRLLQMTVLPYILVSLIVGLGGLDAAMARFVRRPSTRPLPHGPHRIHPSSPPTVWGRVRERRPSGGCGVLPTLRKEMQD